MMIPSPAKSIGGNHVSAQDGKFRAGGKPAVAGSVIVAVLAEWCNALPWLHTLQRSAIWRCQNESFSRPATSGSDLTCPAGKARRASAPLTPGSAGSPIALHPRNFLGR